MGFPSHPLGATIYSSHGQHTGVHLTQAVLLGDVFGF